MRVVFLQLFRCFSFLRVLPPFVDCDCADSTGLFTVDAEEEGAKDAKGAKGAEGTEEAEEAEGPVLIFSSLFTSIPIEPGTRSGAVGVIAVTGLGSGSLSPDDKIGSEVLEDTEGAEGAEGAEDGGKGFSTFIISFVSRSSIIVFNELSYAVSKLTSELNLMLSKLFKFSVVNNSSIASLPKMKSIIV